jgi:excisionase family DNA binding protein
VKANDNRREGIDLSEPLLTAEGAARLLAVRESWIRQAVRDGRVPYIPIGRHVRFHRSDLEAWVREQRQPGRTW